MDIQVTKVADGKRFNRWGCEVIACRTGCGRDTTMLGTKLCDPCWEAQHHSNTRRDVSVAGTAGRDEARA